MRLVRFRLTAVDDSGPFQRVSGRGEGGEILEGLYRPQFDGFTTVPKIGALGYALFDGSRERGIVQGLESAGTRPTGQDPEAKVLYGPDGQKIEMKPGGGLKMSSPTGEVDLGSASGSMIKTIDGKLYLGGDPALGHVFAKVETESGPSPFVYARIG